jgi:hypothetical protein
MSTVTSSDTGVERKRWRTQSVGVTNFSRLAMAYSRGANSRYAAITAIMNGTDCHQVKPER